MAAEADRPAPAPGDGSAAARRLRTGEGELGQLGQLLPAAAVETRDHRGGQDLLARSALLASPSGLEDYAALADHVVIAGTFAGVAVGFAAARLEQLGSARVAVVDALYVEPDARRAGVADAMVEEVVGYAADSGCGGVELTVLPGDRAGKSLLEAWGFTARALVMSRPIPGGTADRPSRARGRP